MKRRPKEPPRWVPSDERFGGVVFESPYTHLLRNRAINTSDLALITYVSDMCEDGGMCVANNTALAYLCGVSPQTVANMLSRLTDPRRDWWPFSEPPLRRVRHNGVRRLVLAPWPEVWRAARERWVVEYHADVE